MDKNSVFVFSYDLQVVGWELLEVETAIEGDANLLNIEKQLESPLAISGVESENQELDQAGVLQLIEREMIVKMLLYKEENLPSQVLVL